MGCNQDDVYKDFTNEEQAEPTIKGKTFIVNQKQLLEKYATDKNLSTILENDFKNHDGLTITTSYESGQAGVMIDLDYIQVFESDQIRAITYKVSFESDIEENGETRELYNLVYFSRNSQNVFVTLFKYDFSQIPFHQFINDPYSLYHILNFFPLNNIENIYENIAYSVSNPMINVANYGSVNPQFSYSMINLADCAQTVYVEGSECKGSGNPKHKYGEQCGMSGSDRATPGYSYMDFSDCYGGPNSGGGGGGGSVGSPGGGGGGGGGYNPTPSPIRAIPIKQIGDFVFAGGVLSQINIGNVDHNTKTLKAISKDLKNDLSEFNSKLSQIRESGSAYSFKTTNGSYSYFQKLTLPNPIGQNTKIDFSKASSIYCGVIHTHPEDLGTNNTKGTPLFSASDLAGVFRFANETPNSPNRKPSEAFIGVVNKYGLYMVMLPNDVTKTNISSKYADFCKISSIGNKIQADINKPKWIKIASELDQKYQKIESTLNENEKKKAHEKALLETLKDYELNLNIYFLHKDEGYFNGSWEQVTLKNGQIQYININ